MEKELSTCRKLSLINPPRSGCSEGLPSAIGAPRPPLLQKRQARRRKKPRFRKSALQPQKKLSACAESELLPAGGTPFPTQQACLQGTTTPELLESAASRESNQNRSQELDLPSEYFPVAMLDMIFFFKQLRCQCFNPPTQNTQVSSALKIRSSAANTDPPPKHGERSKTLQIDPKKLHSPF